MAAFLTGHSTEDSADGHEVSVRLSKMARRARSRVLKQFPDLTAEAYRTVNNWVEHDSQYTAENDVHLYTMMATNFSLLKHITSLELGLQWQRYADRLQMMPTNAYGMSLSLPGTLSVLELNDLLRLLNGWLANSTATQRTFTLEVDVTDASEDNDSLLAGHAMILARASCQAFERSLKGVESFHLSFTSDEYDYSHHSDGSNASWLLIALIGAFLKHNKSGDRLSMHDKFACYMSQYLMSTATPISTIHASVNVHGVCTMGYFAAMLAAMPLSARWRHLSLVGGGFDDDSGEELLETLALLVDEYSSVHVQFYHDGVHMIQFQPRRPVAMLCWKGDFGDYVCNDVGPVAQHLECGVKHNLQQEWCMWLVLQSAVCSASITFKSNAARDPAMRWIPAQLADQNERSTISRLVLNLSAMRLSEARVLQLASDISSTLLGAGKHAFPELVEVQIVTTIDEPSRYGLEVSNSVPFNLTRFKGIEIGRALMADLAMALSMSGLDLPKEVLVYLMQRVLWFERQCTFVSLH